MQHKKVFFSLVFFLALWGLGIFGALGSDPSAPLVLTEKDNGRTITLAVGQRLVVDLKLGPGHHVVAPEFDPWILILAGQRLTSTSGPQGSSSRIIYEFFVRQGGQTELVITAKGSGNAKGESKPLLKVKIVARGGGEKV